MEILAYIVSGLLGFLAHHIAYGRKIMSQLDDLAAAQLQEAANITQLNAAVQGLTTELQALAAAQTKTLTDMEAAVKAGQVSGNQPDLTGFISAAQDNASAIGKAATAINSALGTLQSLQSTVTAADPVQTPEPTASVPETPSPEPAASADVATTDAGASTATVQADTTPPSEPPTASDAAPADAGQATDTASADQSAAS